MSKNNNKTTEALLEMESLKKAIKEESKSTLVYLLKEAIAETIRGEISEGFEDEEKKEDEITDVVNTEENGQDNNTETEFAEETESEEETSDSENFDETQEASDETETSGEGDEEEVWNEFQDYEVDDDTYDFTGEDDHEKLVKVYKLMKDEDNIVVKKDGDKIELKDVENDAEYVIDLGTGNDSEEMNESCLYEFVEDDDEDEISSLVDRFTRQKKNRLPSKKEQDKAKNAAKKDIEDTDEIAGFNENKNFGGKSMKEKVFEVDLGYTDSYQKKDPIEGLSNTEPSKSGKSWHKGVPTGTEKPWAGNAKSKSEPFEKTVNEETEEMVDEATNVGGAVQQRTSSKSHIPANRKEHGPKVKRHVSAGGDYTEMVESVKKLQKENKMLKEHVAQTQNALKSFKKELYEAYVANASLGRVTRLFMENTVSQDEKKEILNRFVNEAKTIEAANTLYENIKKDLSKTNSPLTIENKMTVNSTEKLNENKKPEVVDKQVLKTLDLINRVENL